MNKDLVILNELDNISDLSVAETWMLLKPTWSLREDLLKYILMDLLTRQVLMLSKEKFVRKNDRRKPKTYVFIRQGSNFSSHKVQEHEIIVLNFFQKPSNRYFIKVLLKKLYKATYQLGTVKESVSKTLISKGLIPKNSFGAFFSAYPLTKKGKEKQAQIKRILNYVNSRLKTISNNQEELKKILTNLGPNFILLDSLDIALSKTISKTISSFDIALSNTFDSWDYFITYDLLFDYDFSFNDFDFDFGDHSASDGDDYGDYDY